jgi:hypothetical protein
LTKSTIFLFRARAKRSKKTLRPGVFALYHIWFLGALMIRKWIALTFLVFIAFTLNSEAYIDPGSGSYVLQLIVASFFAVVFTLKVFWRNIKAFFSGAGSKKPTDSTSEQG